nr:hypothetical protein [Tanacetum cinerariifolium]
LTNEEIKNSNAYKEYYAIAIGAAPPKPKASVRKTRSSSNTSITPPTDAAGPRLTTSAKGKQAAKAYKAKSLSALSEVAMTKAQKLKLVTKRSLQQMHISQASGFGADEGTGDHDKGKDGDDDEVEEGNDGEEGDDDADDEDDAGEEGNDDDDDQKVVRDDDKDDEKDDEEEGNGEVDLGLNVRREEGHDEEEEEDKLYRDININQGRGIKATLEVKDSHVILTLVNLDGQQQSSSVSSQFVTSMLNQTLDVDLSEMELKKILNEKMEGNKSIQRSDEQRNLYKALVDAYESDNIILDTYREIVTLKRRRDDDADKDEEPFAGPDRGSKRHREGKEPESASAPMETATRSAGRSTQGSKSRQASSSKSAFADEPMQTTFQMEEPSHSEFNIGAEDQPIVQFSQHPEWFSQQKKPPSLDRDWNKTVPATHGSIQPWISKPSKRSDSRSSFNELMDTPLDLSNSLINRLNADTLTPKLLAGPTYELMKGSCKSLIELESHLEDVFKATTNQLGRVNPEGQQYPHDMLKPLPLIPNNCGHHIIPFEHFINNDLEYLHGGASNRKYTTSITKTKVADYGHIKWIKDLVPRKMTMDTIIDEQMAMDEALVKHKNSKKSNEMYYPRFTKVIIYHFMSKDLSIPRRNQFGALLPIELTNEEIKNSNAYKEYYAIAIGAAPPKPKASVRKTRSSYDTSITPPTDAAGPRLTTSAKGKQAAKASKAKSLSALSEVAMTEAQKLKLVTKRSLQQMHISQASSFGADEGTGDDGKEGDDDADDEDDAGEEGDDDDDDQKVVRDDDKDDEKDGEKDDEEEGEDDEQEYDEDEYDEETKDEESFDPILKTTENSNDEGNGEVDLGLNVGREEGHDEEEEEDKLYRDININQGRGMDSIFETTSQIDAQNSKLRTLEANFSEFMQTNQFAGAASAIPRIVHRYMDQRMNETVHEQVKEQVKVLVSKILPRIEQTVNEQLEYEVLTQSSHSSKTSYAIAADLSEMELKKILIEKMEGNKPDWGSKRRREGKEPESTTAPMETATRSAGRPPFRWKSLHMQSLTQPWISELSKRSDSCSSFNELMDTPLDFSNSLINRLKVDTLTPELLAGPTYKLMKGSCKSLIELETHLEEVFKAITDQLDRVNPERQQYPHNMLKPLPLIPNNRGRRVIPFEHFINNDLEYLRGGASSRKYTTSITKTNVKPA